MRIMIPSTAALLLLAACGDSSGPEPLSVDGSWSYDVADLTGPDVTCDLNDATTVFSQIRIQFSGTISGGTFSCTSGGETFTQELEGSASIDGTVEGTTVTFDIGSPAWRHIGILSGDVISGDVMWQVNFGPPYGVENMTGTFILSRQ